jgi:hypothetical protein
VERHQRNGRQSQCALPVASRNSHLHCSLQERRANGGCVGPMIVALADKQLSLIPWVELRCDGGLSSAVGEDLRVLLFIDDDTADDAYHRLENPVVSQGHLFECAPAVVSVIVAAVADRTVPPPNLAPVLDLLGRILAGYPDESEVVLGRGDLRQRCHEEALRGYWALMRVARTQDPFNAWRVAVDVLSVLDPEHSGRFVG